MTTMGVAELPDDIRENLGIEAERRGLALEEMMVVALREWLLRRRRDQIIDELVAQGRMHRGVPPVDQPTTWQPRALPGKPLSEIIIEDRGPR